MRQEISMGERFATSGFADRHPSLRGLFVRAEGTVRVTEGSAIEWRSVRSGLVVGRRKEVGVTR